VVSPSLLLALLRLVLLWVRGVVLRARGVRDCTESSLTGELGRVVFCASGVRDCTESLLREELQWLLLLLGWGVLVSLLLSLLLLESSLFELSSLDELLMLSGVGVGLPLVSGRGTGMRGGRCWPGSGSGWSMWMRWLQRSQR
jgi:hypothetical protein